MVRERALTRTIRRRLRESKKVRAAVRVSILVEGQGNE